MSNFSIVFPGQGSQYVGMLENLADKFSIVKEVFSISSEVLGYDLWKLTQNGPESELNKTWRAQPAILSASISIFKILKTIIKKNPKILAGHSLGEYTSLVISGVIDFQSAIKLVELRGRLMKESFLNGNGIMIAIVGIEKNIIIDFCRKVQKDGYLVFPSSFNTKNHTVISGEINSVKKVLFLCRKIGGKLFFPLSVDVPSHCKLMKPAAIKLKKVLENIEFRSPNIPIINNVDVKIENSKSSIKNALIRQLYNPVRWYEIIKYIMNIKNIGKIIELGPKNILTNINKRIFKEKRNFISINDSISLDAALIKLKEVV